MGCLFCVGAYPDFTVGGLWKAMELCLDGCNLIATEIHRYGLSYMQKAVE